MDYNMADFSVQHHLPEFAQVHVQWIDDPIQPSYPLLSPSPSSFNLSQHQGLFQWVSFLRQVAKVLKLQLQHQSFQRVFRVEFLEDWLMSLLSKGLSRVFPGPQSENINSSELCLLYCPALTSVDDYRKDHSLDYTDLCWQSDVSIF